MTALSASALHPDLRKPTSCGLGHNALLMGSEDNVFSNARRKESRDCITTDKVLHMVPYQYIRYTEMDSKKKAWKGTSS